jgi:plasmid stabilization system protein ParE
VADVRFHPEAQAEYEAALMWYQARSVRAAARFEAEMQRTLDLIAVNPDLFPPYDADHRFAVLRRYPYSVVYRVQPTQVLVIAVAHSSRSAGYWRGRF